LDAPEPAAGQEAQAAPTVDVSADDDAVKGDENAPVTIIEFSDYQCPFCGRFYEETLPQLEEQYIATGKVKLVHRDFPLESIHPEARPAAEAAECAGDQGKYYEMHDKLYENQQSLSADNYKLWAEEIGLDMDQFNDCVESNKHAEEVSADLADGSAAGVTGTPGFFINGQLLSGAQPFSVFQQIIEAELAAADNGVTGAAVVENEKEMAEPETQDAQEEQAEAANDAVEFDMTAKKYRFDPNEITVSKGSTVVLNIESVDINYGFVIEGYDVTAQLQAGETTTVEFAADQTGSFAFSCADCDGKESVMKGTLVVE
jgi:protein-disulfide isomerase/plastocyanin